VLCPACFALLGCPVCFALYAGTPLLESESAADDSTRSDLTDTADDPAAPGAHAPPPDLPALRDPVRTPDGL